MARTSKNPSIVNRTVRVKLKARRDPYWHFIAEGQHLGYRRGATSGTWIARYYTRRDGRRFQSLGAADDTAQANETHVLSFPQALKDAQEWFATISRADTNGITVGPYTVADACKDYLEGRKRKLKDTEQEKLKPDTATINAFILPTLGDVELSQLAHPQLIKWRNNLSDTAPRVRSKTEKPQAYSTRRKSPATVRRCLNVLKAVLNYAKEETRKITTDDAWIDIKPPEGANEPRIRFLSNDELKAFVPACDVDFRRLVKGALLTGARYGELTRLNVEHFNATNETVFVDKSKNGEARDIHLNTEGVAFFKQLTKDRKATDKIFLRSNGKAWKASEQKRPMDAACKATKIEGVTFHILRHTYASHALINKMPLEVLQKQLGHRTLAVTIRHYAHLCNDYKQQSVRTHAPSFGFTDEAKPYLVKTSA